MEPECSLPHSQEPATCTYPEYLLTKLLTYLITYSMEQSPSWEANRFSASQEISRILWNPKVHYRIHKCPPPVPILSQLDPTHTLTSCRSILILSSHLLLGFPSDLFPSCFPTKTIYTSLLFPYMLRALPILFISSLLSWKGASSNCGWRNVFQNGG